MVEVMSDSYRAVPEGVVNDRWMHRNWLIRLLSMPPITKRVDALMKRAIRKANERGEAQQGVIPPRPAHFDFRTPEYTSFKERSREKFEATRGKRRRRHVVATRRGHRDRLPGAVAHPRGPCVSDVTRPERIKDEAAPRQDVAWAPARNHAARA